MVFCWDLSIIMSNYVVLCLLEGQHCHSGSLNKFTDTRINLGNGRPISVATYHHRSDNA